MILEMKWQIKKVTLSKHNLQTQRDSELYLEGKFHVTCQKRDGRFFQVISDELAWPVTCHIDLFVSFLSVLSLSSDYSPWRLAVGITCVINGSQ
jgi:hypothetical protein